MYTGPNIVTDGLVLHLDAANPKSYPGSGTTWNDLSGNGNNGTLVNGPTFDSGNNGSLAFDGNNDYSEFNNTIIKNTSFTIGFWMYHHVEITQTVNGNLIDEIIGTESLIGSNKGWTVRLLPYYENTIGILVNDGANATTVQLGNTTIEKQKWNYWVGTLNINDNTLRSYVNSELDAEDTNIDLQASFDNNTNLSIGYGKEGSNRYLNGQLSNIKIYNKALTQQEILQNYNATKSRFGL
jgi:hypothetical protein